ncbi:MAG: B12-binding domain-containing protein, partial [Anaerolineae bacterium]
MSEELVKAIADMREDDALQLAKEMVDGGVNPMEILAAGRKAMDIVGQRFEEGQYFLPELIMSGEMLNQITEMVKPELAKMPQVERKGTVVLG